MHIVLLRGINVGGKRKVPMADLRSWLAEAGYDDVRTYIASGNVLVPGDHDAEQLASDVAQLIAEEAGFDVPTVARDVDTWEKLVSADPWPTGDDRQVHLGLPTADGHVEALAGLVDEDHGDDELRVSAETVWLHTPNGFGRSKLVQKLSRKAGDKLTFRNRRTLKKLLEMADEGA